jgi:hypothetical protein
VGKNPVPVRCLLKSAVRKFGWEIGLVSNIAGIESAGTSLDREPY